MLRKGCKGYSRESMERMEKMKAQLVAVRKVTPLLMEAHELEQMGQVQMEHGQMQELEQKEAERRFHCSFLQRLETIEQ